MKTKAIVATLLVAAAASADARLHRYFREKQYHRMRADTGL
jgi:hypothetical protein